MARTVDQILAQQLSSPKLDFASKMAMIEKIRDLLFEAELEAITDNAKLYAQPQIVYCAECGSVHVSKYGRRYGRQRYRCVDCGKTFTEHEDRSLIKASKLNRATWMRFINCFVDGLTVRKCAANCNVSVNTAYYMRVRILTLIADSLDPWLLEEGDRAQLDETYFHESFSGNHGSSFELPRPAVKTGRKNAEGGVVKSGCASGDNVYVITGIDEKGRMFAELAGRGRMDSAECEAVLAPKLAKGSHVTTDEHKTYIGTLRKLGVGHAAYNSLTDREHLNKTNSLHSHIKNFFKPKRGVSTRRLPLYLAEFTWRWQLDPADQSTKNVSLRIVRQIATTNYQTKLRDIKTAEFPLVEWWYTAEGEQELKVREIARIQQGINRARMEAAGDPDLLAVVNERQEALNSRAEKEGVKLKGGRISKDPVKPPVQHMSTHLLRRNPQR